MRAHLNFWDKTFVHHIVFDTILHIKTSIKDHALIDRYLLTYKCRECRVCKGEHIYLPATLLVLFFSFWYQREVKYLNMISHKKMKHIQYLCNSDLQELLRPFLLAALVGKSITSQSRCWARATLWVQCEASGQIEDVMGITERKRTRAGVVKNCSRDIVSDDFLSWCQVL